MISWAQADSDFPTLPRHRVTLLMNSLSPRRSTNTGYSILRRGLRWHVTEAGGDRGRMRGEESAVILLLISTLSLPVRRHLERMPRTGLGGGKPSSSLPPLPGLRGKSWRETDLLQISLCGASRQGNISARLASETCP